MEVIRSAPDGSGVIVTSIYKELDGDKEIMLNVLCASDVLAGSPAITITTFRTIAVCKRVDSSNFCVQLPASAQFGAVIEFYADGGEITIFPPPHLGSPTTFFDGSSSVSTSGGAQFRFIVSQDGSTSGWARLG